jgi:hypothetical protein
MLLDFSISVSSIICQQDFAWNNQVFYDSL